MRTAERWCIELSSVGLKRFCGETKHFNYFLTMLADVYLPTNRDFDMVTNDGKLSIMFATVQMFPA